MGRSREPAEGGMGGSRDPAEGDTGRSRDPAEGDTGRSREPTEGDTGRSRELAEGDTGRSRDPAEGDTGRSRDPAEGGQADPGTQRGQVQRRFRGPNPVPIKLNFSFSHTLNVETFKSPLIRSWNRPWKVKAGSGHRKLSKTSDQCCPTTSRSTVLVKLHL